MSEGQPSVVLMLAPEHLLDLYARRPRWCAGGCGGARGGDRGVTVEIPAGIGMGKVGEMTSVTHLSIPHGKADQ